MMQGDMPCNAPAPTPDATGASGRRGDNVPCEDRERKAMKVRDMIERLQKRDPEAEVCVSVTNCISAYAAEPVTYVSDGFDWTAGKVMIETGVQLQRVEKVEKKEVFEW